MTADTKRWALWSMRWLLPAAIAATGIVVILVRGGDDTSLEAGAMFIGAGIAVALINVFFRLGVSGDSARDREEEARRYFDEHGHWPDQVPENQRESAGNGTSEDPARPPAPGHRVDDHGHARGVGGGGELRRTRPRRRG